MALLAVTPQQHHDRTLVEIKALLTASAALLTTNLNALVLLITASGNLSGHGSPEGVVVGIPGKLYIDLDTGTIYTKMTGTGNTGWIP